jgi:phosphoribosylformylglycinamidine synthase PurS subunit
VKVTVLVRPKEGILDPQGEAIRQALTTLGYPATSVRAGRVFDVELDVADTAEAERVGREAADRLLANGLIEGFEVVVEGAGAVAEEAVAEAEGEGEGEEVAAE